MIKRYTERLKEIDHSGGIFVGGRIILKLVLNE
jgi:hypothetical protein